MIFAICPRSHQNYLSIPIFGPILDECIPRHPR